MSAKIAFWTLVISSVFAFSAESIVIHVPADQPTIQAGINAATHGDTVLVAPGTYFENINFRGKNIVVASQFILDQDEQTIENTVINGSHPTHPDTASCVLIVSGETSAGLEGLTLTGGTGTAWRDIHNTLRYREGGGILIEFGSPTIRNNRIENNEAINRSGLTSAGGGGIRCGDSNPLIEYNLIRNNRGRYGAGIVLNYATGTIRRNIIVNNSGGEDYGGGGIWTTAVGPNIIENNTIVGNSCVGGGSDSHAGQGGGILVWGTTIMAENNIIWNNTQVSGGQIAGATGSQITYNDIQDGYPGTGNMSEDPQFADAHYSLSPESPCIDSGNPGSPLDPDGTRADMGARYFYHLDAPYIHIEDTSLDDSQGDGNGRADGGETVEFSITLMNTSLDATGVTAVLSNNDQDVSVVEETIQFGSISRNQSVTNEANPFTFSVAQATLAHRSTFQLDVTADGGYEEHYELDLVVGTSTILMVDDDNGESLENEYVSALETRGIFPMVWEVATKGRPTIETVQPYDAVIWQTGNDRQTSLTSDEQAVIASFLDGGGRLIIAGSNIGYDLVEDGSPGDATFFADYLRAEYTSDAIAEDFLYGVQGDPITGQFTFFALDAEQTSASVIAPLQGAGTIMTYYSTGQTAAIKYDDRYKLVYFAVGLNDIMAMGGGSSDQVRGTLLGNALTWFSYVPAPGDVNQDGKINILDVLTTVNIILGIIQPSPSQESSADCNGDATVNILDALGIVNVVLGIGECR